MSVPQNNASISLHSVQKAGALNDKRCKKDMIVLLLAVESVDCMLPTSYCVVDFEY